jgi:hypothetical protein
MAFPTMPRTMATIRAHERTSTGSLHASGVPNARMFARFLRTSAACARGDSAHHQADSLESDRLIAVRREAWSAD